MFQKKRLFAFKRIQIEIERRAKRITCPTLGLCDLPILLLFRDFSLRSKGFAEAIKREHQGVTECAFSGSSSNP